MDAAAFDRYVRYQQDAYRRYNKTFNTEYWDHLVSAHGSAVNAAKHLLRCSMNETDFVAICLANKKELTLEYAVQLPQFQSLFEDDPIYIANAKARLELFT